jgi:nucleotide-binding universal stress UspA family protein
MAMSNPNRPSVSIDARFADGKVAACVDRTGYCGKVLPYARSIANAIDVPATLLHVVETRPAAGVGPDPIEWELLRREARSMLDGWVKRYNATGGDHAEGEVIEGRPAEQICRWAREHAADLIVLCTQAEGEPAASGIGTTAREVVEHAGCSVLLVPASVELETDFIRYRRILVPLDGSPLAESVIPLATRIAGAHGAELLLVHVVPVPELTQSGPTDVEDLKLLDELVARNEAAARKYLNSLKTRLVQKGVGVRVSVLRGGDVRSRLPGVATENNVDLVLLSAHGRSGRSDTPYGSVTSHLVTHLSAPLMIVRPKPAPATVHLIAPTLPIDRRHPNRDML